MKLLRWIGITLVGLLGLLTVAAIILYVIGGQKLARTVQASVHPIEIPSDSAAIAEGRRYTRIFLCVDCHGDQLEGQVLVDDPVLGRLTTPHIAPGMGSVTEGFTSEDWIRAIRHGVGGDGRPLVVMPSKDYNRVLSDVDLANIIAYLQQSEPVEHDPGPMHLRLAQVLIGAGVFPIEFDGIDHSKPAPPKPEATDTLALGEYFTHICRGCHGADLMGSDDPDTGGPGLARGGRLEPYDESAFLRLFRSGAAQNDRSVDSTKMPWKPLGEMTDGELLSVWAYLRTVPVAAR